MLHVCTTCRAGRAPADGEAPPGQHLFDAVAAHAPADAVAVRGVICLAACDHGCAAAISAPGKWSYLLGSLDPSLAGDLLAYAATYGASPTGAVLRSRRPASLAHAILGRMPDLTGGDA